MRVLNTSLSKSIREEEKLVLLDQYRESILIFFNNTTEKDFIEKGQVFLYSEPFWETKNKYCGAINSVTLEVSPLEDREEIAFSHTLYEDLVLTRNYDDKGRVCFKREANPLSKYFSIEEIKKITEEYIEVLKSENS